MYQGKAPELSDTRSARMPAFFEHQLFPDKYPDYLLSDKEICYRAGQVSVIRYLKEKFIED